MLFHIPVRQSLLSAKMEYCPEELEVFDKSGYARRWCIAGGQVVWRSLSFAEGCLRIRSVKSDALRAILVATCPKQNQGVPLRAQGLP